MRRRRGGFTLIEMLVATVVLGIGIAGLLGAISAATRAESVADQIHTAVLLSRQQLATVETNLASLSSGDTSGDFGSDYPGFSWSQDVQATDSQYNFLVALTVQWGDPLHPQQYVVSTYLNTQQAINAQSNGTGTSTTSGTSGG